MDDDRERKMELPPDNVLREMAEDAMAWQAEFDRVLKSEVSGSVPCRRCGADAIWTREIRWWSIKCPHCAWGAAGMMSAAATAN